MEADYFVRASLMCNGLFILRIIAVLNRLGLALEYEQLEQSTNSVPCQSLKELSHGHEIQLIRTVEHYTLYCHSFA